MNLPLLLLSIYIHKFIYLPTTPTQLTAWNLKQEDRLGQFGIWHVEMMSTFLFKEESFLRRGQLIVFLYFFHPFPVVRNVSIFLQYFRLEILSKK